MTIKPLPASSMTTVYNVAEGLRVEINVRQNPYQLPLDALFEMALRKNPKRRFLFVSKILGKHLPVSPQIPGLGGRALALCYAQRVFDQNQEGALQAVLKNLCSDENGHDHWKRDQDLNLNSTCSTQKESIYSDGDLIDLSEKTVFIGFAETATALGYSVFSSFKSNAQYTHTTRENLKDRDVIIRFEEEHSHATAHRLFSSDGANPLMGTDTLVLVDDEITTGKTALNIIEAIQSQFPRKNYALLSLLDWRSPKDLEAFTAIEKRLGITITTVSLVAGEIHVQDDGYDADFYDRCELENTKKLSQENHVEKPVVTTINLDQLMDQVVEATSISGDGRESSVPYILNTGRFGIDSSWIFNNFEQADQIAHKIMLEMDPEKWGSRCLCLGTGEFMQLPVMVAAALDNKLALCSISFQSTTRSPICPLDLQNYGARSAYRFACPEDSTVLNHVYNIRPGAYDTLLVFMERSVPESNLHEFMQAISAMGIANVGLVFCHS